MGNMIKITKATTLKTKKPSFASKKQTPTKQRELVNKNRLFIMCHQVACRSCGKPTWSGCGMHVFMALGGVDYKDRCPNWQQGSAHVCTPDQKPTIMSQPTYVPSFFGSVISNEK